MFLRYPSLERLGNVEVEGIEAGVAHVFPKLDGTNSSMWLDEDTFGYGSRNRTLSLDNDNGGFMTAMETEQGSPYKAYLRDNPKRILYGEWLIPHTIKGYRPEAWKKFYVFDVYNLENDSFIPYDQYVEELKRYEITFIPCIKIVRNGTPENFLHEAKNSRFLLTTEAPFGEGVVIKNYDWENKFKRVTWAKVVNGEFKDDMALQWGPGSVGGPCNEEILAGECATIALIEKEYAKIVAEKDGWSSKDIPRLLETVFYCVVKEELYSGLKKIKFGTVNFNSLKSFVIKRIKEVKPELF